VTSVHEVREVGSAAGGRTRNPATAACGGGCSPSLRAEGRRDERMRRRQTGSCVTGQTAACGSEGIKRHAGKQAAACPAIDGVTAGRRGGMLQADTNRPMRIAGPANLGWRGRAGLAPPRPVCNFRLVSDARYRARACQRCRIFLT